MCQHTVELFPCVYRRERYTFHINFKREHSEHIKKICLFIFLRNMGDENKSTKKKQQHSTADSNDDGSVSKYSH